MWVVLGIILGISLAFVLFAWAACAVSSECTRRDERIAGAVLREQRRQK